MFGRIANILGWAGVALVLAGVATWLVRDDLVTLRQGFAISRPRLHPRLRRSASGARWAPLSPTGRPATARWRWPACSSSWRSSSALNYLASKYQQALGPDLVARVHAVRPDPPLVAGLKQPLKVMVFSVPEEMQPFRDRLSEYANLSSKVQVEYIDIEQGAGAGPPVPDPRARHHRRRVPEARRAGDQQQRRAGHHQRHRQGRRGPAEEGLLRRRPRREGSRPAAISGPATTRPTPTCRRTTSPSRRWRWRSRPTCPPTPAWWWSPARPATCCRRRSRRCAAT